jgi:hypothetical protein
MVDDPAHYRWSSYRHNAVGQATGTSCPIRSWSLDGMIKCKRIS